MAFINEIFKISLFLPEEVKIDSEKTKGASDGRQYNRKKTADIRDQVFLATGIPPSPNTSRIIGHM
jgi:hypothetical protein